AYTYTVEEVTPDGYSSEQAEGTNDFTNTAKETSVEGTKTWQGRVDVETNPDITITLFRNGVEYATQLLTGGATTYAFTGLPTHDELGQPYTYEVQEVIVPAGYTSESEPNETNGKDFTNSYTASGTLDLSGTKTLTGREGTPEDIFTFKLYKDEVLEANLLDTKTVTGGSGPFSFDQITYTLDLQADPAVNDLGEHTYIVVEEVPDPNPSNGITYDTTQYTVNVTVTDNGDGTLNVAVPSENATSLDFINNYEAKGEFDVDLTIDPTKVLTNRDLTDGEFTFELRLGIDVLQTVTNTADGNIPFLPLEYTQDDIGATYDYTINEVIPVPGEIGMTYDPMVIMFSVTVTDLGGGVLSADLVEPLPADTTFNNVAPLTRYRIYYYYRMTEDDAYVRNVAYDYVSGLVAVGTRAGAYADRSENGFWQLMGSAGNRRVLVYDEAVNIVSVYYQRAEVPLGGGVVINVGDCSE
ncbi:MAG: Cna B-type domain-containing protein, partial [Clostridiales bacterium]|nr:Cna B-type domain-containing protein [Clostridiales bacterium]